jgi:hypothetical protein
MSVDQSDLDATHAGLWLRVFAGVIDLSILTIPGIPLGQLSKVLIASVTKFTETSAPRCYSPVLPKRSSVAW